MPNYLCSVCFASFTSQKDLEQHKQDAHEPLFHATGSESPV